MNVPIMPLDPATMTETALLTAEQFGAFMRLNLHLWVQGGRLPSDPATLATLCHVAETQWERVWRAIGHLFVVSEGQLTRPALSAALAKARANHEANQARSAAMLNGIRRNRGGSGGKGGGGGGGPRQDDRHGSVTDEKTSRAPSRSPSQLEGLRDGRHEGDLNNVKDHATVTVTAPVKNPTGGLGGSVSSLISASSSDPDRISSALVVSGSVNGSVENTHTRERSGPAAGGIAEAIRAVFTHYRGYHPRAYPNPVSGSKEWGKVAGRLREGYSVADLCKAIDGYHNDPFHCGDNDRGRAFLGLELIVRDGTHVNTGIEYAEKPAVTLTARNRANARGISQWLETSRAERAARRTQKALEASAHG